MMSNTGGKERRRRRRNFRNGPPDRLAWGGGGEGFLKQELSNDNESKGSRTSTASRDLAPIFKSNKRKLETRSMKQVRSRKRTSTSIKTGKRNDRDTHELWTDFYAPTNVQDLSVAPKKVYQVQEWLHQHRQTGGMLILTGPPGIGKSTMVKVILRHMHHTNKNKTRNGELTGTSSSADYVQEWIEAPGTKSPLQSWQNFMSHALFQSKPILMDELPNLHTAEQQNSFRDTLQQHVLSSSNPTIWVYSTSQGNFEWDTRYPVNDKEFLSLQHPHTGHGLVQLIQINPATNARMKKILSPICKSHRMPLPQDLSIFHGDVRNALLSVQTASTSNRDAALSPFHAIGKLLYAKRNKKETTGDSFDQEEQELDFDPEQVMQESLCKTMSLASGISYLQAHCVDFFTDITELSTAFHDYSDAVTLLEAGCNSDQFGQLDVYASSLASRAMAHANQSPAKTKFRSFSSPPIFNVWRKTIDNKRHMQWNWKLQPTSTLATTTLNTFCQDYVPFLRRIEPSSLSLQLYSHIRKNDDATFSPQIPRGGDDDERNNHQAWKEQEEILAMDDIVDHDSDGREETEDHDVETSFLSQDDKQFAEDKEQEPLVVSQSSSTSLSPTRQIIEILDDD